MRGGSGNQPPPFVYTSPSLPSFRRPFLPRLLPCVLSSPIRPNQMLQRFSRSDHLDLRRVTTLASLLRARGVPVFDGVTPAVWEKRVKPSLLAFLGEDGTSAFFTRMRRN